MAEGYSQQFRGKVPRVYLGEGRAESVKQSKTRSKDTAYNRYMQELFDVTALEAVAERVDAVNTQAEIAVKTAELLKDKSTAWDRYRAHKNITRFINDLDTEWRGRELPHKLERILMFSMIGAASSGMDVGADILADKTFLRKGTKPFGLTIDDADTFGNRKALKAGWEMVTDHLIGVTSDSAVKEATNREDIQFVSPLSDSLSKIGNVLSSVLMPSEMKLRHHILNSLVNPSTIESGFRALAAIPVLGAKVEHWYSALNTQLLHGEGMFPFGFDVAVTMLAAKENQKKSVETIKAVKT